MICKICGANNADNAPFCNDCGAPLIGYGNQPVQQQAAQPQQMQQQQPQQVPVQQQAAQPQQMQQQPRPMGQQQVPQQMSQQQMEQEWMKQQWLKQQAQQQSAGMAQPQAPQQPQQIQQPGTGNNLQWNSQNGQNSTSGSSTKKKSHTGVIIGIIIALVLAAAAAVFFIFVMPKLSKAAPKGEYVNDDFAGRIIFDDGVYSVYDDEGGYEFGTYEVKGGKITFTTVNGDVDYGTYNKKDNTVEYGYLFTLDNAEKTFDVEIDESYVNGLKVKIEEAAKAALSDEEVKAEALEFNSDYYIYGSALVNGNTAFTKALADNLGYVNDKVLSYLLENNYISIDISIFNRHNKD